MNLRTLDNREFLRLLVAMPSIDAAHAAELLRRFEALVDEFDDALVQACREYEFTAQDMEDLADAIGCEDIADACKVLAACNDHDVPMPDAATLVEAFSKTPFPIDECAVMLAALVDHEVGGKDHLTQILEINSLI